MGNTNFWSDLEESSLAVLGLILSLEILFSSTEAFAELPRLAATFGPEEFLDKASGTRCIQKESNLGVWNLIFIQE